MNCKAVMAAAVVAVFLISVSSAVFADNSDAAVMTDGESGIGYSIKDMSKEDLDKIVLPASYECRASFNFNYVVESVAQYTITDIVIEDYKESAYQSVKVSGKEYSCAQANSQSYKMTFKAKCTSDGGNLFIDDVAFSGLIKEVGIANQNQNNAEFTITAKFRYEESFIDTSVMEKNSADNFVVTKDSVKNYGRETVDLEVKYSYTSGGNHKELSFDVSYGRVTSMNFTNEYDFGGVAFADVTNATRCIVTQDFDGYYDHHWYTVDFDDDNYGTDVVDIDYQNCIEYREGGYYFADVATYDMSAPEYHFYGTGDSLFGAWSEIDDSLRDDAAMKAFLEKNGSIAESYDDALSGAEDIYDDMLDIDSILKILGIIGIIFLLFIVAVIVLIIVLVRARKKQ